MLWLAFEGKIIYLLGIILAFTLTIVLMKLLADKLPHDQGRAFAVDGQLSKGKVRGTGIVFVLVFALTDLLCNTFSVERLIYIVVIILCMLTGFFDDAAEKPWNEYLKGALDFILAVIIAVTYLYYNGNSLNMGIIGITVTIPYVIYGILIVALVWVAINVTNCTDGVDSLSATLSIITMGSFYLLFRNMEDISGFNYSTLIFMVVLVAYLWYNANPSSMLMGDAGSRAMGMMIAITALMSHNTLLYIPFSIVMILDGGLGLVKVSVIRFLKIKNFMSKIRCPLHDQARKVSGWSNTQVVIRFAIIQTMVSAVVFWMYVIFAR